MFPEIILRNFIRLLQMMSRGFSSRFSFGSIPSSRPLHPHANVPVQGPSQPSHMRCPHCRMEIPGDARVCHHCKQFVSLRFNLANIITIVASVAAVAMSVYSLYVTAAQADNERRIQSRRFLIETLRNMQQIQDELQDARARSGGGEMLTEKEILLLNYHQVLSGTLAQFIKQDPELFVKGKCTYDPSIRLRKSPTTRSEQLGWIYKNEEVYILGKLKDSPTEIWYYVASSDRQKIGWLYKHVAIVQ